MRTEAIAALVSRLERERDDARHNWRLSDRRRRDDYDRQAREFELRTRTFQATNEHLISLLAKAAALEPPRPIIMSRCACGKTVLRADGKAGR